MGFGAMIPKPSGHTIPPVVWKAPVHSAGSLPRHRLMYWKKPPDTQVRVIWQPATRGRSPQLKAASC